MDHVGELERVGFRLVAKFMLEGEELSIQAATNEDEFQAAMGRRNALYAFWSDEGVRYIGRTTQAPRTRFYGYLRPQASQATNVRNNRAIRALLARCDVRISIFFPPAELSYAGLAINLALGLEESLIQAFAPPWNGARGGVLLTEEADKEIEAKQASPDDLSLGAAPGGTTEELPAVANEGMASDETAVAPSNTCTKPVGNYYWRNGVMNYPAAFSALLAEQDAPLEVVLEGEAEPLLTRIDREASGSAKNSSIRIRAPRLRDWFQSNFQRGELLRTEALSPNRIRLSRA